MKKQAVIVIDMLNDFVSGSLANPRAANIIAPLQDMVAQARAAGVPLIFSNDAHLPGIDPELKLWGEHAIAGSQGAEFIPELTPIAGDFLLPKRRYSSFFQTDLHSLLRDLGVDTLVICGMLSNICIQHTAADAYMWGFSVVVPRDGVEALDGATQESALEYMQTMYAADITTCADVAASWQSG
ncbi:MAG: cysteine hydrolase [Coriobacteriia bacterium]|nr:cysteine hydrolase [Coriobacteriia bacterium]